MRRPRLLAAGLAFGCVLPAASASAEYLPMQGAVLQGLDKITARVTELVIPNGESRRFGPLEIRVEACNERPPEEPPEAAAFVEILDVSAEPPASPLPGLDVRVQPRGIPLRAPGL